MNGKQFKLAELEEIRYSMVAAKEKVNLNLLCSVMFEIIDEYILERPTAIGVGALQTNFERSILRGWG